MKPPAEGAPKALGRDGQRGKKQHQKATHVTQSIAQSQHPEQKSLRQLHQTMTTQISRILQKQRNIKTFKHPLNTRAFIWKIYVSLLSNGTFIAERVRLLYIPIRARVQAALNPRVNFLLLLTPACGTRLNFTFKY